MCVWPANEDIDWNGPWPASYVCIVLRYDERERGPHPQNRIADIQRLNEKKLQKHKLSCMYVCPGRVCVHEQTTIHRDRRESADTRISLTCMYEWTARCIARLLASTIKFYLDLNHLT